MMLVLIVLLLKQGIIYHEINNNEINRGARGSLRLKNELARNENKGIDWAIEQIEDIKHEGNHITAILSYADLIQLGGYAAVEYCGGPSMFFRMGRVDAESEADASP